MYQPTSPSEALRNLEFQLSLLQIGSTGAETPQAEELEQLLNSQPRGEGAWMNPSAA